MIFLAIIITFKQLYITKFVHLKKLEIYVLSLVFLLNICRNKLQQENSSVDVSIWLKEKWVPGEVQCFVYFSFCLFVLFLFIICDSCECHPFHLKILPLPQPT